jgi:hypothetical protein
MANSAVLLVVVLLLVGGVAAWMLLGRKGSPSRSPPKPPTNCGKTTFKLGMATNEMVTDDPGTLNLEMCQNFLSSGLCFFWNWGPTIDIARSGPSGLYDKLAALFVPMLWSISTDASKDPPAATKMAQDFGSMMLYNEPDHWGPNPQGKSSPLLSSGTLANMMQCGLNPLVTQAQATIAAFVAAKPKGQLWSPAMAGGGPTGAPTDDQATIDKCNSAAQWGPPPGISYSDGWPPCVWNPPNVKCISDCSAWLPCFKQAIGASWDAVDIIQFHAYAYDAPSIVAKAKLWAEFFADDVQKGKTLAITELAQVGNSEWNPQTIAACKQFMTDVVAGLKQIQGFSHVSWFSSSGFASFATGGKPDPGTIWVSNLYEMSSGQPTDIGAHWFSLV